MNSDIPTYGNWELPYGRKEFAASFDSQTALIVGGLPEPTAVHQRTSDGK